MAEKKSSSGKKPPPPPVEAGAEGGGTAARLRSIVFAELSKRFPESLFEDLVVKGGLFAPGGPDCGGGCKGNCSGTCDSSCVGDCIGSCGGNCKGKCTGDCHGTCTGTCAIGAKADRELTIMPEDLLSQYILTVMTPAMDVLKLVLAKQGFPR